jgi:hypothetical protein
LQYLVFAEGIVYNKEKDRVRTLRVNSLFAEILLLTKDLEENKKGDSIKNCPESHSVHRTSGSSNFLLSELKSVVDYQALYD